MPADPFVLNQIRGLPIFERLLPEQLEVVGEAFEIMRMPQGGVVFIEGQPSQGFYLFTSGRGALTQRTAQGEFITSYVQPGQPLNEVALFRETTEANSLRILEEAVILFLSRRHLVNVVRAAPEVWANLRVPVAPGSSPIFDASAVPVLGTAASLQAAQAAQAAPSATAPPRQVARRLFAGQRVDESVIEIFRPHWWTFGRYLWIPGLVALAGLVGTVALLGPAPAVGIGAAMFAAAVVTLLVGYLIVEWRNDNVILTDQRVVRVWNTIIPPSRSVNEIPLERVLEVNYEVPPGDAFAQLFHYGTVEVRTAGEAASFTLPLMQNPARIQRLIFAERDTARRAAQQRDHEAMRREVAQAVAVAQGAVPPGFVSADGQAVPQVGIPSVGQSPAVPAPSASQRAGESLEDQGPFFARTRFSNASGEVVHRHHLSVWLVKVMFPLGLGAGAAVVLLLSLVWAEFPLYGALGVFLSLAAGVFALIWLYLADWDWRNDMFIIGNDSIKLIHQRPLWLQNEVQQIRLAQVDNVVSDTTGIFNNLLNRGDVRISLIGSNDSHIINDVYDAEELRAEISQRQAAVRARNESNAVNQQRQAVIDYLAAYHQTVQGNPGGSNAPAPGIVTAGGVTYVNPNPVSSAPATAFPAQVAPTYAAYVQNAPAGLTPEPVAPQSFVSQSFASPVPSAFTTVPAEAVGVTNAYGANAYPFPAQSVEPVPFSAPTVPVAPEPTFTQNTVPIATIPDEPAPVSIQGNVPQPPTQETAAIAYTSSFAPAEASPQPPPPASPPPQLIPPGFTDAATLNAPAAPPPPPDLPPEPGSLPLDLPG